MRTLALIAIAILLNICMASAQQIDWHPVLSEVTAAGSAVFTHVSAPDNNHVVVIGFYSSNTFLKMSADGGSTWKQRLRDTGQPYPDFPGFNSPPLKYWDVATPTPRLVLIASDSGIIFRSTNWGEDWQRVNLGGGPIFNLAMSDSLFAVAVQYRNRIWATNDGGAHWDMVVTDTSDWQGYVLRRVEPVTSTNWIAYLNKYQAPPMIARTTDAGRTWTLTTVAATAINDIDMVDSRLGYAFGAQWDDLADPRGSDIVLRTTDSGASWETLLAERIDPSYGLLTGTFADALHGIAVGYRIKVLVTSDGGVTWQTAVDELPTEVLEVGDIKSVAYPSRDVAYIAAGGGVVYKSSLSSTAPSVASRTTLHGELIQQLSGKENGIALALDQCTGVSIELFDGLGERRYQVTLDRIQAGQRVEIPTADLPSGVYVIRVRTSDRVESRSVILG